MEFNIDAVKTILSFQVLNNIRPKLSLDHECLMMRREVNQSQITTVTLVDTLHIFTAVNAFQTILEKTHVKFTPVVKIKLKLHGFVKE